MRQRALQPAGPQGGRPKKLLIAVYLARKPDWAPCESCDCVGGESQFPRWAVDSEAVFPDGAGGYSFQTRSCPRRTVTADSLFLVSLYRHYKAGHLYVAGGVADQPVLYLKAMQIIEVAAET